MRKRLLRSLIVVAAIVAAVYFGLFFGLRRCTFATSYRVDDVDALAPRTIRLCWFSDDRTANAMWFYFFRPIHAVIGRPYFAHTLTEQAIDDYDGWPYYLYDPSEVAMD